MADDISVKYKPENIEEREGLIVNIADAPEGMEYLIHGISSDDEELNAFLFTLGCYPGEKITVVSHRQGSCVIAVKDGRYSIDAELAKAIEIDGKF